MTLVVKVVFALCGKISEYAISKMRKKELSNKFNFIVA